MFQCFLCTFFTCQGAARRRSVDDDAMMEDRGSVERLSSTRRSNSSPKPSLALQDMRTHENRCVPSEFMMFL